MANTPDEEWGDFQEAAPPPAPLDVPMHDYRRSTGPLTTSQLANCMAIVAYYHDSGEAVLYHLNTQGVFDIDQDAPDTVNAAGDVEPPLRLQVSKLQEAKERVDGWLGRTEGVRYAIALGFQWGATGSARPERKAEFVEAVNRIFAPTQFLTTGQSSATWDPFTEQLS